MVTIIYFVTVVLAANLVLFYFEGHKITICGDATDSPTFLCVQHSPPLPYEFTTECIAKVTVSIKEVAVSYLPTLQTSWFCRTLYYYKQEL